MSNRDLITLLDEVRGKTLRVLEGVSEEHAAWAPAGLQNSIRWHAGHSYVVVEWLTMTSLARDPQIPEGWYEIFSWESKPALVPAGRWPVLGEIVSQLRAQHQRLRQLFTDLTDAELSRTNGGEPSSSPCGRIIHGLHDEACHCGEMMLLRKLISVGARGAK
jgi:hypothetical protein